MTNVEIIGVVGSFASIVSLLAFFGPIRKLLASFRKPSSIDEYLSSLSLRKNCRIAIVDDEIVDFPINYLKSSGYDVETFPSIDLSEFKKLLKFDLVFLDVQGVVKSDYEYGGAKLIKLLKAERPLLPVVAVSSGKFKTSLTDFFELSDDRINKPIEELKIKEVIDEILNDTFNVNFIKDIIINMISCSKSKNEKKIHKEIIKYFSGELTAQTFEEFIHKNTSYKHSRNIVDKCKIMKERLNND